MYPSRFEYDAPKTLEEAIAILDRSGGEAKVLAGGQSLVPMLKLRFASPERIVDINGIPGLNHVRVDADGTLRIGFHAGLVAHGLGAFQKPLLVLLQRHVRLQCVVLLGDQCRQLEGLVKEGVPVRLGLEAALRHV